MQVAAQHRFRVLLQEVRIRLDAFALHRRQAPLRPHGRVTDAKAPRGPGPRPRLLESRKNTRPKSRGFRNGQSELAIYPALIQQHIQFYGVPQRNLGQIDNWINAEMASNCIRTPSESVHVKASERASRLAYPCDTGPMACSHSETQATKHCTREVIRWRCDLNCYADKSTRRSCRWHRIWIWAPKGGLLP